MRRGESKRGVRVLANEGKKRRVVEEEDEEEEERRAQSSLSLRAWTACETRHSSRIRAMSRARRVPSLSTSAIVDAVFSVTLTPTFLS